MRRMSENELKIFTTLAKLTPEGLFESLSRYLKKYYTKIIRKEKYLYAIGDIPIALIAHADTVFSKPPDEIFYDMNKNVIWGGANGLGADDRAGIFAILKIIQECKNGKPHIIITTEEELGCIGAKELICDNPKNFAPMKYIIQLDRRGKNDCVFYQCGNSQFIEYISAFGFVKRYGSFSDISVICPSWDIAGVNLSIGYEDEHSYSERLYVSHMFETIDKVLLLLEDVKNLDYDFEYAKDISDDYYYNLIVPSATGDIVVCHKCGNSYPDYETFLVQEKNKEYHIWCPECITKNIKWCDRCGGPFETSELSQNWCYECRDEGEKSNATKRN